VSERKEMRVNAAFGRADLMNENHFRFPRQSHLPTDYFEDDLGAARGIMWGLIVIAAGFGLVAMLYAALA
jgi:hypothetical protein